MLTNFPTIRKAVKKMANIDKLTADGTYSNFPNREGSKPGQGQLSLVALMDARSIAATAANGGVITAATAGFCFGVQNAVDTVYKEIEKNQDGPINTFGPIIHNENVVEELKEKGVGILNSVEEAGTQKSGTIIIRSHGVAKKSWEDLNRTGARVVDTTCTFVKKIHEIVHKASEEGKQIVIIGNHGHAETEGTVGGLLAMIGALFLLFSDTCLSFVYFKEWRANRTLSVLELATYFAGQALIALSIMYV